MWKVSEVFLSIASSTKKDNKTQENCIPYHRPAELYIYIFSVLMVGPCLNAIITVLALQSVDEMSFWYLGGLGETRVTVGTNFIFDCIWNFPT